MDKNDIKKESINKDIEFKIGIMYAEGKSKSHIAQEVGISYARVSNILNKKMVKLIVNERLSQIKRTLHRAFATVDNRLIKLVDRYSSEALNEERIERTPLRDLFNVMQTFSNRYEQLQKYEIERERLALERERISLERERLKKDEQRIGDGSNMLIKSFFENIEKSATKLKIEGDNNNISVNIGEEDITDKK